MASKIFPLVFGIGLTIWVAQVQSQLLTGTPTESPSLPKNRTQKRTEAASPVESAESRSAAESPAASPTPRLIRRKTMTKAPASPTLTPVVSPTPRKFKIRFPRLFKPKRSPSASPAGVNYTPASGSGAAAGPRLRPRRVMRALGRRSKIGHQGSVTAMAAKPTTAVDGLRLDRFFQLVSACRRSLAGTQPGTLTQ